MPYYKKLQNTLPRIHHPRDKEYIRRRLKVIFNNMKFKHPEEIPTLDECYRLLGMYYIRKKLIKDINKKIMDLSYSYHSLYGWVEELYELHKNCESSFNLLEEMIRCYLHEEENKGVKHDLQ